METRMNNISALKSSRIHTLGNSIGVYAVVIVLIVIGSFVSKEFLTYNNSLNTIRSVALLGIVAVGVAFVTYSGHYADLSVPSIMALSGIVAVSTMHLGVGMSFLCAIAAGLFVGLVNGLVIGFIKVNPIIWTLAMGSMVDGILRWAFSGKQIYPDAHNAAGKIFLKLYDSDLFGTVPLIVIILLGLVVVGSILLKKTGFGAQLKIVGASYPVAQVSGINVRRSVAATFAISALTAAIGGILLASLNKVGAPYLGKEYDFMAVTAVVVGGISLAGGRGNIFGVLGGVLVIGLMRNILTLLTVGTFTQDIIQGIVFVIVVGAGAYSLRKSGRDDS